MFRQRSFSFAAFMLASLLVWLPRVLADDEPIRDFAFTPPAGWHQTAAGFVDGVPFWRFAPDEPSGSAHALEDLELVVTRGSILGVACSADTGPAEVADLFMTSYEKRMARWRSFLANEKLTTPSSWSPMGTIIEPPLVVPAPTRIAAARTRIGSPAGVRITLHLWIAPHDEGPLFEIRYRAAEASYASNLPKVLAAMATLAQPATSPGGGR